MRNAAALGILVLLIGAQQIRTARAVSVSSESAGTPAAAVAPPAPVAPSATGVKVIINASNGVAALPRQELARIFLKKDLRWPDGTLAEAVEQPTSSAARHAFNDRVLAMSDAAVESYWREQAGRVSASVEASDVEVVARVRTNSQAVAYVSSDVDPGPGVRVLAVLN